MGFADLWNRTLVYFGIAEEDDYWDEDGYTTNEELESLLALYGDVRGLMTMPPAAADPEASRPYFRRLRELAGAHGLRELSMGTSQDYLVAVEEGATYVRLGSVLWSA